MSYRIPNPYHELLSSFRHLPQYRWARPRSQYLHHYLRWRREVLRTPPVTVPGPEKLTVILLSYRRVRNMEPIVEALLRAAFIERIVVSNNNPEIRIGEWIRLRDERLRLIDQPRRTAPGIRFELAREEPGRFFLSIDDDVLLSPEQVKRLFLALVARPEAPHGIQGEDYVGESKQTFPPYWRVDRKDHEGQVDNLNTVYAFTRDHLAEMERLAGLLGLDRAAMAEMGNGEDLLISASGTERPYIHDVGPVAFCLSSHRIGVATWASRPGFFTERKELFLKLRALRPDLGVPAAEGVPSITGLEQGQQGQRAPEAPDGICP